METPTKMKNNEKAIIGLNRTMQYGNEISTFCAAALRAGLNRTMQYGNVA